MRKAGIAGKVILSGAILLAIAPIMVMLYGSFKSNVSMSSIPPDFSPRGLSLRNYIFVVNRGILRSFLNSFSIAAGTTAMVLLLDRMAGFVFGAKQFPGKNIFFTLLICTMMIPKQILIVPMFILLVKIGIHNTIHGIVLSAAAVPFGVFLIKQLWKE